MRPLLLTLVMIAGSAAAAPEAETPTPAPTPTSAAPSADAEAPPPADAEAPPPADAEAPPPAEAPTPEAPTEDTAEDTEAPEPTLGADAWRGLDRFVGPAMPAPAPAAHDDTADEEHGTDPAHTPDAEHASDAAHTADADHTSEAEHAADAEQAQVDAPTPQTPLPLPRHLPFLPSLPLRGWRVGILLAIATALAWGAARGLSPVRDWLAPTGVLPTLASAMQQIFRALALFFVFGVIAAIIPENLEPALPWVVLAGALAIGWSLRDVTPDLLAGVILSAERRVKPGQWIGTKNASGVVDQVTLRVTWVRDATGRRMAVPNRVFLRDSVITDRGQWPSIEIVLRIPGDHPPSTVRRVVEDAVMVSPWSAPLPPDLVREEQGAGLWRVRARVLEGRFADRFEGALREHVEEVLKTGAGLRGVVKRRGDQEPEASE